MVIFVSVINDPVVVEIDCCLEDSVVNEEFVILRESATLSSRGGVFDAVGGVERTGLTDKSGCALTKLRKLISVLISGSFHGKRRKVMHRKMIAILHTSDF